MQPVVLKQELRLHGFGILRIAHRFIKIDYPVEHLRRADPVVQGAATLLMIGRIITVAFKRGDGGTKHVNALLMRLTDNLLIHILDTVGRLHTVLGTTQVVDSLKEDDPLHAFLTQQITLITASTRRA